MTMKTNRMSRLIPSAMTHDPSCEDTAPPSPSSDNDGTGRRILGLCHIVCSKAERRKAAEFKNRRRLACLPCLSTSSRGSSRGSDAGRPKRLGSRLLSIRPGRANDRASGWRRGCARISPWETRAQRIHQREPPAKLSSREKPSGLRPRPAAPVRRPRDGSTALLPGLPSALRAHRSGSRGSYTGPCRFRLESVDP